MKSTYSVAVTATIFYDDAEWQVRFSYPAAIDFSSFNCYIEDIESRASLPSIADMQSIAEEYDFDDEADIKIRRIYKIGQKEFLTIVHGYYDSHEEMYEAALDSVQPSFCRNCGAEGDNLEPDAADCVCECCGQRTRHSLGMILMGI